MEQRYGSLAIDYDGKVRAVYVDFTPGVNYGFQQDGSERDGGELTSEEIDDDLILDLNSEGIIVGIDLQNMRQFHPQTLVDTLENKIKPRSVHRKPFFGQLREKIDSLKVELLQE